ncbi:JmjC-domain-containing protein [Wilcoxina mikolae CBS 423.85]|nr:JmjC-domain-containing protein [Wilcoxina mikolae CBS 423.85]
MSPSPESPALQHPSSGLADVAEPITPPQSARPPDQGRRLASIDELHPHGGSTHAGPPPSNGASQSSTTESDLFSSHSRRSQRSSRSTSLTPSASGSSSGLTQTAPSVLSAGRPSGNKSQPRIIRTPGGTVFEAWPLADRPDAPTLGDEPKRAADGSIKPRTKREAEEQLEVQWQKRRKLAVAEKVFQRLEDSVYGAPKSDMEGTFTFEGEPIPAWLNAEREYQDDGRPGTYIIKPNRADFEGRWPEILRIMEPFGMRLGIIKCKIPEEWPNKAVPYSEYLAANPPAPVKPPAPAKPPRKKMKCPPKTYRSRKSSLPHRVTSTASPERWLMPGFQRSSTVPPMFQSAPVLPLLPPSPPPPPEMMVYTMSQFLPLHTNSTHRYAPIYEVVSKNKKLVPIKEFPHNITADSSNHRIPEETMLRRGRSWHDIVSENPGGEVYYSSDNDATDALRSYLGLVDPRLQQLKENHMFDSTEIVIGIHTPYLYLGNPYTLFALHQEDYCALSLNFHHKGAPKMWRVTCPLDFEKVESLVNRTEDILPGEKMCSQHVRHASVFLSKGALELADVRSILVRQQQGEMVITWPLSYHQGWNEGSNICEAIAYGSEMWKDAFVGEAGEKVYRSCGRKCVTRGMGLPIELKFQESSSSNNESVAGKRAETEAYC